MLEFKKCDSDEKLKNTAEIADKIWHEHFHGIISDSQIEYMLEKFQSYNAMKTQEKDYGYEYYNFVLEGKVIGYFAICEDTDNTLFLSKLYLMKEYRGNHYSTKAFEFIKGIAKARGNTSVWLTVNRHNDSSIAVYKAFGMKVIREQVSDIGNGFVMDDYVFSIDIK